MVIFLYHWKILAGKESQFEKNWALVTKAILDNCGSYGSRLHRAENGEYFGYAQWPDAATRDRCELPPSVGEARQLMREAVEQSYPERLLQVTADFLVHPT